MTTKFVANVNSPVQQVHQHELRGSRLLATRPRTEKMAQLAQYFQTSPRYTPAGALAAVQEALAKAGR